MFNYNRSFVGSKAEVSDDSNRINKMKNIVFQGKPKRIFRTNRNLENVTLHDPKRVHQALREFGDMSASSVFQHMLDQIA